MEDVTQTYETYSEPVMCPGKEIACMICGIHALVWSILGGVLGLIPFYGFIFLIIYGLVSLGGIIPALVLYNDIKKIAEKITNKAELGKKFAIASIIILAVAVVIAIIVLIIVVLFFGGVAVLGAASSAGSYY